MILGWNNVDFIVLATWSPRGKVQIYRFVFDRFRNIVALLETLILGYLGHVFLILNI